MQESKIIAYHKLLPKLSFFILASLSLPTLATFPNVESMLDNYRTIAPVASPEINDLIFALDALSGQQLQDSLQTLTPVADGSLRAASDGPMNQILYVISDHVLAVQQERCSSNGIWGQILGDKIDQGDREDIPGYKAYVLGGIIGRDQKVCPQITVGLAAGYDYAKVNSFGPSGSYLHIERIQGSVYGRYDSLKRPIYALGVLTLARDHYNNHRKILVPPYSGIGFSRTAEGEFVAWETHVHLENGYDWKKCNFHFIPKIMLSYSHLNPENYIEHDAFGLNLNVKYQSMDFLDLGAGAQLEYRNLYPQAYVNPEIHGFVFYDFIRDKQLASANMLGGGFAFLSQGVTPPDLTYEVGVGIAVHSYKKTLVKMQYDYVAQTDYHRNQVFIKVRHEWG